jgi:hypothetical protein
LPSIPHSSSDVEKDAKDFKVGQHQKEASAGSGTTRNTLNTSENIGKVSLKSENMGSLFFNMELS